MRWTPLAFLLLALGGCGSSSPPQAQPALAASAVPGKDVTVSGFVSGTERVFQGESHDLVRVVSRTLEFESPEAAHAYVDLVRTHVDDLYGVGTTAEPLDIGERTGYVIDPAACACHRAAPILTAAVSDGSRVSYLEINGDGVDRSKLEQLLSQAP
jgi:hypothetical protein